MDSDGERDPDVRYCFGHDPGAPRRARELLDGLLVDPDDVIGDDVRLAASELVTNVVRHTKDGGELRVWDPEPEVPLRVEVEDRDEGMPAIPAEPVGEGGRGLSIVDSVSEGWGVESLPGGKIVWAEFDRDQRTHDS